MMPGDTENTPATPPQGSVITGLVKFFVPIALILLMVVGGLYVVKSQFGKPANGVAAGPGGPAEIQLGKTLPDFELSQFQGKDLKASELGSKVMLVNFWATWCEACMVEMPSIIKLRNAYAAKGFEVVAVNVDQNPNAVLPRTIQKFAFGFPVYFDKDQKLSDLFNIEAIPLTVILDKDRKILLIENGERDWNGSDIRAQLERWLAG